MKTKVPAVRVSFLAFALMAFCFASPRVTAQDLKPERPEPAAPSSPPSSPAPSSPAPSTPSEPSRNYDSGGSRNNDSGSSRNYDRGSSRNNDSGSGNRRDDPVRETRGGRDNDRSGSDRRSNNDSSAPVRRSSDGDGSDNRRDRAPVDTSSGAGSTRNFDRGGDSDRDRDRDKDGRRGRHDYRNRGRYPIYDVTDYDFYTTIYDEGNYGGYGYSQSAYQRGYEDGLFTGANDARRGQSYDP